MRQRGSVLILSVSVTTFLALIGASFLIEGLSEMNLSTREGYQSVAFQMAEAGLDQSLRNLRTATNDDDVLTGSLANATFSIDSPPTSIAANVYQVTTHGLSQQEQRTIEAVIQQTPQSVFQYALFGDQNVSIGGNAITDSFNSSQGLYDDQTPGQEGDVGTNATTAGGVDVDGTSLVVNGQIVVGPEVSDPASVVTGNVSDDFIMGDPKYVSQTMDNPMTSVSPSAGCESTLPPNVGGVRTFSNAVYEYCLDSLTVNGNETVTADGPVRIYLSGALTSVGNTTIGVESDPTAMVFLMMGGSEATLEGSLTGSTQFYGAIYGPNAKITIAGNATEVYGSVVAKEVVVSGNAQIHYDEKMSDLTDVSNVFSTRVLSWREP